MDLGVKTPPVGHFVLIDTAFGRRVRVDRIRGFYFENDHDAEETVVARVLSS